MTDTQALLFDLGGVIIEVDFHRALAAWHRYSCLSMEQMMARFQVDQVFERHERGEIAEHVFYNHMRTIYMLDATDADIAAGWNKLLMDPIDETLTLIPLLRQHLPCYGFSNTNRTHIDHMHRRCPGIFSVFDRLFTSVELGMRKPERAAFEAVAAAIGMSCQSIGFFDDSVANIAAAKDCGFNAVLVRGPDDVRAAVAPLLGLSPNLQAELLRQDRQ